MKAIDTNVLVRFLMEDDLRQTDRASALIEMAEGEQKPLLVTIPVLMETMWVLRSSFGCAPSIIVDAIESLTLMPAFRFEALDRVKELIRLGRTTKLELADVLIGLTARDLGAESTWTFDKDAAKTALFELLR